MTNGMTRHANEGRPERTLMVILTDGEENSSSAYNPATIRSMIERARALFGWEFVLIGVGVDADRMAREIGVLPHLALPVSASKDGMRKAFQAASTATTTALTGQKVRLLEGKS